MLQLKQVSVPIRGLFNLTKRQTGSFNEVCKLPFPSPLGDYLI